MILQYSCKNYKSIGDKITLNMLATNDNALEQNIYDIDNNRVLKESVIYGANGSGKSNFINSLLFLKSLVLNSNKHNLGDNIRTFQNKLNLNSNTEYSIHFIYNDIRYFYGLSYNDKSIDEEYLYYFPNGRKAKIFDRQNNNISYGENFKKDLSAVEKDYLKPNRLMLSCAADRKNIEAISNAYLFFNIQLVIYNGQPDWNLYSTEKVSKNDNLKKVFLDFMHIIGKNSLVDISAKVETSKMNPVNIPPIFSSDIKAQLQESLVQTPVVKFNYDKYEIDINEESQGIQKLFSFFVPFVDIILNGKVLLCDEFETHLHPIIVRELLKMFENNSKTSQLIFTTHDVNLLDLSLFRRDQIWFTEQKENSYTDLYSLSDLKNIRNGENIAKNYILGKYSGIPVINEDIETKILEEISRDE